MTAIAVPKIITCRLPQTSNDKISDNLLKKSRASGNIRYWNEYHLTSHSFEAAESESSADILTVPQRGGSSPKRPNDTHSRTATAKYVCIRSIFDSGSDQALTTLAGLDHITFWYPVSTYEHLYSCFTPYRKDDQINSLPNTKLGHPRIMDASQSLALWLTWFCTRSSVFKLCVLFCMKSSFWNLFLRLSSRLLFHVLAKNEKPKLNCPTLPKIHSYQAFLNRYVLLSDNVSVADGLNFYL